MTSGGDDDAFTGSSIQSERKRLIRTSSPRRRIMKLISRVVGHAEQWHTRCISILLRTLIHTFCSFLWPSSLIVAPLSDICWYFHISCFTFDDTLHWEITYKTSCPICVQQSIKRLLLDLKMQFGVFQLFVWVILIDSQSKVCSFRRYTDFLSFDWSVCN